MYTIKKNNNVWQLVRTKGNKIIGAYKNQVDAERALEKLSPKSRAVYIGGKQVGDKDAAAIDKSPGPRRASQFKVSPK